MRTIIYSSGVVCASVCAPKEMPVTEIEEDVNLQLPTGIDSKWKISKDATFKTGEKNPHECEKDEKKLHYLLNC